MQPYRRLMMTLLVGALPFVSFSHAAYAQTVVQVALWDKGETSMDMTDTMTPMGMAMAGANMDMATMGITVDTVTFPAGEVTFEVLNDTLEFYHSMIIAPVDDPTKELPYLNDMMMVDDAAAGSIAQVSELRPHASGSVTVDMSPGTYILYCNIAGHYVMGMWTLITVTG